MVLEVLLPERVCRKYICLMIEEDLTALRAAVQTLEHPGLAVRLAKIAGKPIELVGRALPVTASKQLLQPRPKRLTPPW